MMLKDLGTVQELSVLFGYLFGRINKTEYKELIGDKARAKELWSQTVNNGYVLKNCKLFAYAVHCNRRLGLSTSPAKYGIQNTDVNFLRKLNLTHLEDFKSYSLFDYDQMESAIFGSKELKDYLGKFITKKFWFLMQHYGTTRSDLSSQMLHHAIFAVRKQYPKFQSELHILNVCKATVHTAGLNIINYHTTQKRNTLQNTRVSGGERRHLVNYEDAAQHMSVMPSHSNEFRLQIESLVALSKRMTPTAQKFISAAAGLRDPWFSATIGMDNAEACDTWPYTKYLAAAQKHFDISPERCQKLFRKLRAHLE